MPIRNELSVGFRSSDVRKLPGSLDGTPRKFLTQVPDNINLVAVDVSEVILGTFDFYDCLLVGQGDVAVHPIHQRRIFGLFREVRENDADRFKSLAKSYSHIEKTLHGILFLFRRPKQELFNFRWNMS
jgi:hypothetical protein